MTARWPLRRRAAGVSLLETTVAVATGGTVLFAAAALSQGAMRNASGLATKSDLSVRAAEAANAMVRDLLRAGIDGEDGNGNRVLDAGEDLNRNGRLDADWSLEGGASAPSITFNQVGPDWLWTGPVTFEVKDATLRRVQAGNVREIVHGVDSLSFIRNGNLIDIVLTLAANDRTAGKWTETVKRRVDVRN